MHQIGKPSEDLVHGDSEIWIHRPSNRNLATVATAHDGRRESFLHLGEEEEQPDPSRGKNTPPMALAAATKIDQAGRPTRVPITTSGRGMEIS